MKRRTKAVIASICLILLMGLTILPTFALPNGPSSINYCGLGTGTDTRYYYTIEWTNPYEETSGVLPDDEAVYDVQAGGLEFENAEEYYESGTVFTIRLYTFDITNGMRLLPYYNMTSIYYINSTLFMYDMFSETSHTVGLNSVKLYNAQDQMLVSYWDGLTPAEGREINSERISYIEMTFITETGFYATNIELRNTTITQELRITGENYEGNLINFMPFTEEWFADYNSAFDLGFSSGYAEGESIGRQIGFDQGYAQGYDDGIQAGGDSDNESPIQNWADFMLSAVGGFMNFEIYPNFPLWALLASVVALPLLIAFLKIFAGG